MTHPTPQPGILNIALYVSGEGALAGHAAPRKLSANENPRGPSPAARAAFAAAAQDLHRYPPTDHGPLRRAIGAVHGLDPDRIVCGAGSDEVLQFAAQAYAGPGDEVITTAHGFAMYPILAHAVGATPVTVPEADRVIDPDAILAAVSPRTRLVFLANPANPTGTMVPAAALARLADALPNDCLLVHDGAYAEYVDGFDGGAALAEAHPNVLMTRTLSKIHGLGGLRVGWGYAARPVIDVLNRLRQPFNLGAAQLAAAEAAVRDPGWVAACRAENAAHRATLTSGLRALGLGCDDSHANFVLARFAGPAEAEAADAALRAAGILVRRVAGYGLPQALRITVGTPEDVAAVLAALRAHRGEQP